jgi:hypothetical protein
VKADDITLRRDLELHARGRLGKAEGQIPYLRLLGMVGWAFILFRNGVPRAQRRSESILPGFYTRSSRIGGFDRETKRGHCAADEHRRSDPRHRHVLGHRRHHRAVLPFYYFTLLATVLVTARRARSGCWGFMRR